MGGCGWIGKEGFESAVVVQMRILTCRELLIEKGGYEGGCCDDK